jgi:hypothetical protein
VFTYHKNNRFEEKLITQNINILICPPHNYRSGYGTVLRVMVDDFLERENFQDV